MNVSYDDQTSPLQPLRPGQKSELGLVCSAGSPENPQIQICVWFLNAGNTFKNFIKNTL